MINTEEKEQYRAPQLTAVKVAVEKGFATSMDGLDYLPGEFEW